MKTLINLKPGIPKRYLLFVAAVIWSFAGVKLNSIGLVLFNPEDKLEYFKMGGSVLGGLLFYFLMFSKLSKKHIDRISQLPSEKPFIFFFFNLRSYILMSVMMTSGILTRKFHWLPNEYISIIYVTMGIPLFLSSLKFYYWGFNYSKLK